MGLRPICRGCTKRRRQAAAEGSISDSSPRFAAIGRASFRDPLCLLLVSAVCSAAYVLGLRLYSDDWFFIEPLATAADQSWSGLYNALAETPFVGVRPVQILWYIAFHKLAPGNVVLVHVANHVVFAASALIVHAALRATPATRRAAYYVALLYVCLPTFSVAKMWYANHQAVLSLFLFALTWLLVTRIAKGKAKTRWWWVPMVALTVAVGNLAYELFSITELAVPLFVWWALGARVRNLARDPAFLATTGAIVIGFAATTLFKLTYDYGVELPPSIHGVTGFVWSAGYMYASAAKTTFWTLGLYSPRAAAGILASPYLQPGSLLAPTIVLLIVGAREWLASRRAPVSEAPEASPAFLALSGVVAFGLGYVPYLTNFLYSPKPWGEGNRGNIAAALGAALLVYVAFRWARDRWPAIAGALLVVFCVTGAFLQVAVGRMWVRAAVEQDRVFARFEPIVRQQLADRGTVLVYGNCPYYGAGPVFAYGWDLQSRLAIESGYRNLEVVFVRPEMTLGAAALATPPSRWGSPTYRYGAFHILDLTSGSVTPIDSLADAQRFFAARPLAKAIPCEFDFGTGNPLY